MSISYREVHVFGGVVGRVQTPKKSYFMPEIVVNKMRKLPDDVAINKPIPRKSSLENGIRLKNCDTERNQADGNKTGDKAIENVSEKRNFVLYKTQPTVKISSDDFDNQQNGNQRAEDRTCTFLGE